MAEQDKPDVILLVEDDAGIAELVSEALDDGRKLVIKKSTAQAARVWLESNRPQLVLLDYSLPDATGLEFVEQLSATPAGMPPFIVTTGMGDEHVAVTMMKHGARDYLVKSRNFLENLPMVVEHILTVLSTERQLAETERALRASEANYRTLIENSPYHIARFDTDARLILFNRPVREGLKRLFQLDEQDALGKTYREIGFPDELCNYWEKCIQQVIDTGEPLTTHHPYPAANGLRTFEWLLIPEFNPNGSLHSILSQSRDITESKRAEDALRESEARYRAIFDSSPIAIWDEDFSAIKQRFDQLKTQGVTDFRAYFDANPQEVHNMAELVRVLEVNQASTKFAFGETRPDAARRVPDYFAEKAMSVFKEELITLASGGTYFSSEIPIINKNGQEFTINLFLSVTTGYEETLSRVLVSFVDITVQKQAAQALMESEARLNKAQEIAHVGDWTLDLSSLEIFASAEAFQIIGIQRPPSTIRVEQVEQCIVPEDRTMFISIVEHWKAHPDDYDIDFRIHRLDDGELRHIHLRAMLRATNGQLASVRGTIQDITERKIAEESLRHYLSELEVLYDNSLAISLLQEPNEIGHRIIETLARNLAWHHVAIRLRHGESDYLELIAFNEPGQTAEEKKKTEERFNTMISRVGQGLSGWVIQTGRSVRASNVLDYPQYIETCPGVCSGLYVPIKVGERTIGCISVESETPNAFSEEDERLLATLAAQDAVAFENARLYRNARDELEERKRAEEALRESQYRLDLALRSNQMGVWHWDILTDERYLDNQVCEMFGINPADFKGTEAEFRTVIHPEDYPIIHAALQKTITQNAPYEPEFRCIWPDGSIHHIATRGKLVRDADGRPTRINGINWDITERKLVEKALKTAEADYQALFENAPIGIYQSAPNGHFLKVNQEMANIFGYESPAAMLNAIQSIASQFYIDPDARNAFQKLLEEQGEVLNFENRCMHKNGSILWISEEARSVKGENGQTLYYEGFVQNINDRKLAEQELRESEERLAAVMEGSQLGYMDFDICTGAVQRNNRWAEMLGYSPDEIEPNYKQWEDLIHPDDLQSAIQSFADHLNGQTPIHRAQYRLRTKDGGYKWVLDQARVVERDNTSNPLRMSGTLTDITELKLAEERVTSALHEKEVLLRELYHRTKNNMQVIISMMSLESMQHENEELQRVLQDMNNRILSMALVHQMLYRSKNLSSIDLRTYISDLSHLVMDNYRTKLGEVNLTVDSESIMVLIDTAIPCGLITNEIISNALKYAFPDERPGQIIIRIRASDDGLITIEISDNGIGMPTSMDIRKSKTLGMQIIFGIAAHQLKAKVDLKTRNGFTWRIEFADDRYRPRV